MPQSATYQRPSSVSPDRIADLMKRVTFTGEVPPGTTSTLVHAFLDGDFYLGSGHSACVTPANFDAVKGVEIAKAKAIRAATEKLWELEGYMLREQLRLTPT